MPIAKEAAAKTTAAKRPRAKPPVKQFSASADWEKWLAKRQAGSRGLWVQIARKTSGLRSVTYAEAVSVALCHGWIDGQKVYP